MNPITLESFADLVERMRHAQVTYFRDRSSEVLQDSKALEREVDKTIRVIRRGDHKQPKLFE